MGWRIHILFLRLDIYEADWPHSLHCGLVGLVVVNSLCLNWLHMSQCWHFLCVYAKRAFSFTFRLKTIWMSNCNRLYVCTSKGTPLRHHHTVIGRCILKTAVILQHVISDIKKKINSMVWVRELTIPTERPPLVGEVIANFCGRECHVVSVTDPYGRIIGFLDRSRYFSIK
jgi:hypothetical protein